MSDVTTSSRRIATADYQLKTERETPVVVLDPIH